MSLRGLLLAEYKILYGINVASQAADDHVQCVLQRTLIPYKILYSARRMPRKLTEQLVRSKEAADVARYSAYVRGRLHIPSGQRTCRLHIVHGTTSSCYDMKPKTSLDRLSGQQIHHADLNPVDYMIWWLIQERVCQTAIRDIDDMI